MVKQEAEEKHSSRAGGVHSWAGHAHVMPILYLHSARSDPVPVEISVRRAPVSVGAVPNRRLLREDRGSRDPVSPDVCRLRPCFYYYYSEEFAASTAMAVSRRGRR